MAAADSIPKFFDELRAPSPGGWHYFLDPETKQYQISGTTPQAVFDQFKAYLVNNRRYTGDEEIWRQLWRFWCSIEPERCVGSGGVQAPPKQNPKPGKEVWGPILWRMLNWAAVNYRHEFFHRFVTEMREQLIICPECRSHFEELIGRFPLSTVTDQLSACLWTHRIHEAVSASLGKKPYPYHRFATEFGAPTP